MMLMINRVIEQRRKRRIRGVSKISAFIRVCIHRFQSVQSIDKKYLYCYDDVNDANVMTLAEYGNDVVFDYDGALLVQCHNYRLVQVD